MLNLVKNMWKQDIFGGGSEKNQILQNPQNPFIPILAHTFFNAPNQTTKTTLRSHPPVENSNVKQVRVKPVKPVKSKTSTVQ